MDWFQQEVTLADPPAVTAHGETVAGEQWQVPALIDWTDQIAVTATNATRADQITIYIPATVRRPRPGGHAILPDGERHEIFSVRPWDQLEGFPHVVEVRCGKQR